MARIDRAIANLLHEKNLGLPPMFTRSMMQKDFFYICIKGMRIIQCHFPISDRLPLASNNNGASSPA